MSVVSRDLTATELAVLRAAAAGKSIAETAALLRRSPETIRSNRKRAFVKLGARNVAHAVALANERGLLGHERPPDPPITPGKRDAFHAKCNDLARTRWPDDRDEAREEARAIKQQALVSASRQFGREIESVNDLTSSEASWTLDWLEAQEA